MDRLSQPLSHILHLHVREAGLQEEDVPLQPLLLFYVAKWSTAAPATPFPLPRASRDSNSLFVKRLWRHQELPEAGDGQPEGHLSLGASSRLAESSTTGSRGT